MAPNFNTTYVIIFSRNICQIYIYFNNLPLYNYYKVIKLRVNDLALKYDRDLNATELHSKTEKFNYQAPLLMTTIGNAIRLDILKHIDQYSLQNLYPN